MTGHVSGGLVLLHLAAAGLNIDWWFEISDDVVYIAL